MTMLMKQLWRDVVAISPRETVARDRLCSLLVDQLRGVDRARAQTRLKAAADGDEAAAIDFHRSVLNWYWELTQAGFARIYPTVPTVLPGVHYVEGSWTGRPSVALITATFEALDQQRLLEVGGKIEHLVV